jgi:acyl carrier protein
MSRDTLEDVVIAALTDVAPDIAGEVIDPHETFRDQFEIDSMDFLNFVVALNKATGVEIREADYPKLQTLDGAVAYLRSHERG